MCCCHPPRHPSVNRPSPDALHLLPSPPSRPSRCCNPPAAHGSCQRKAQASSSHLPHPPCPPRHPTSAFSLHGQSQTSPAEDFTRTPTREGSRSRHPQPHWCILLNIPPSHSPLPNATAISASIIPFWDVQPPQQTSPTLNCKPGLIIPPSTAVGTPQDSGGKARSLPLPATSCLGWPLLTFRVHPAPSSCSSLTCPSRAQPCLASSSPGNLL